MKDYKEYSKTELCEMVKKGDTAAYSELTVRYKYLVKKIAYKVGSAYPDDIEDYCQEGLIAIYHACLDYEENKGSLDNHISWNVYKACILYFRNKQHLIPISREYREVFKKIAAYMHDHNLVEISDEDYDAMSLELEISVKRLKKVANTVLNIQSGTDSELEDYKQYSISDENLVERQAYLGLLSDALNKLEKDEYEFICKRYGINGYDFMTLQQLGKEYGMSTSNASNRQNQIEKKLLELFGKK